MNIDALFYLDKVRTIALALPHVAEGTSYGTPGFYAGKKLIARLREEGDILVVYCEQRGAWMKKEPAVFYITPHYENSKYMLVALPLVKDEALALLLKNAWAARATKTILKQATAQPNKKPLNKKK